MYLQDSQYPALYDIVSILKFKNLLYFQDFTQERTTNSEGANTNPGGTPYLHRGEANLISRWGEGDRPVGHTRGRSGDFVGGLHPKVAPRVSTLLIDRCKTPICPLSGPTWGRWGMTLIGALL
jgi:hypothetical protein